MIQVIIEGLMLGLSTGAYCISVCLVFFMPYLLVDGKQKVFENLKNILSFLIGRFIAYIGFALLMGIIGDKYQNILTTKFSHVSLITVSTLMIIYALVNSSIDSKFCKPLVNRFSMMRIPFLLGLFSGLNPCLPFLVGVTRLWTLNSIFRGVILFSAFFIGTSVYMIPFIFVSYLNRIERVKQIGVMVAILAGFWFLFVGISGLIN